VISRADFFESQEFDVNGLNVIVLKFGSSVLSSTSDLTSVVDECYRHLRDGKRVLAVVSAFAGVTDRLIAEAHALLGSEAPNATADYVACGERLAAALLDGALIAAGISSRLIDPREVSLAIEGDPLNAELKSIDAKKVHAWLEEFSVLVLPGFFGIDAWDRVGLLGRGGSDYSALFLAQALNAECRLIKDVAGIYDADPAIAASKAHRFERIGWTAAAQVAGKLVQPKALQLAYQNRLPFSVGSLLASEETHVGDFLEHRARPHAQVPPLKVALFGLGVVGAGVYKRLSAHPDRFEIIKVVVKNPHRHAFDVPDHRLTSDTSLQRLEDIDLLIDCMSGLHPSVEVILEACKAGLQVVSANKRAVASSLRQLQYFIEGDNKRLSFGAAVGGAVPVLETLRYCKGIQSFRGIINGTCNYILSQMREGIPFEKALESAQGLGIAESDPFADISGQDAADKLAIIAAVGFQTPLRPDAISTQGIGPETDPDAYLIAEISRTGAAIAARVAPVTLSPTDFLAGAEGAENRVEITLMDKRIIRLKGMGAGRSPTTTAVFGDVLNVWREHCESYYSAKDCAPLRSAL
jgi:homoserine dehydrogenase